MIFLDKPETRTFIIDIEDEVSEGGKVGNITFQSSYKQRVLEYLSKNSDNPVIEKIKNLEQLTHDDIRQLEKVLWTELGDREEYERHTAKLLCGGNVAIFIRSLVGIDRTTALEKFSKFLDTNSLNSDQQEYLKSILDYVCANGDINGNIITNTEPFNEFDWQRVYGSNLSIVGQYVNEIHRVITA